MIIFETLETEESENGFPPHLLKFDHSGLENGMDREGTNVRYLQVSIGYRFVNKDAKWNAWHDEIFIEATLKDDTTGEVISKSNINAFDFTTTKPPARFDKSKVAFFSAVLTSSNYTLSFKSKFAAAGNFQRSYLIFTGGAEVYLNGVRYQSVYFEPTVSKPYSKDERFVISLNIDDIISQPKTTEAEIKEMYLQKH